jgi:hypothetical protein
MCMRERHGRELWSLNLAVIWGWWCFIEPPGPYGVAMKEYQEGLEDVS